MPKDTEVQIIELLKELKDEKGLINVSLSDMADSTGLSISTVQRAIKSLEEKGVIARYRKKSTEPQLIIYKSEEIVDMIEQIENTIETCRMMLQALKDKVKEQ
jgi:DNA-binding MarR family transcriptional regulator